MKSETRRNFVKKTLVGAAGISIGLSAKSYARIPGANDRINFGVAGLNGRGKALVNSALGSTNTSVGFVCDVDSRVVDSAKQMVKELSDSSPKGVQDIRRLVEEKDLDALAIATPDHWHAPMALMGVQAGKHVYVEKPCCHNPKEGEMLVEAQKSYGKYVQMGNQQRSGPTSIQAVQDIREGIIGEVYFGKAWYSNKRGSIGTGKKVATPDWLDWELWQGPAPREDYRDNLVYYNWHWFWNWGTGEINNNGTHEIDICRWALGVDYPISVNSSGGRYHFDDDWQFYDTQVANFEFEGGKMITWEGKSCNSFQYYDRGRGVTIHGTKGTALLDRNGGGGGRVGVSRLGRLVQAKPVPRLGRMDLSPMIPATYVISEAKMPPDATQMQQSKPTNIPQLQGRKARLLTRGDLDKRTRASRQAEALAVGLESDLGGPKNITIAQRQLIEHAAVMGAIIEHYGAQWLAGKSVDVPEYLSAINAQRRVLVTLGLERRARDITPSLQNYLEGKTP